MGGFGLYPGCCCQQGIPKPEKMGIQPAGGNDDRFELRGSIDFELIRCAVAHARQFVQSDVIARHGENRVAPCLRGRFLKPRANLAHGDLSNGDGVESAGDRFGKRRGGYPRFEDGRGHQLLICRVKYCDPVVRVSSFSTVNDTWKVEKSSEISGTFCATPSLAFQIWTIQYFPST